MPFLGETQRKGVGVGHDFLSERKSSKADIQKKKTRAPKAVMGPPALVFRKIRIIKTLCFAFGSEK